MSVEAEQRFTDRDHLVNQAYHDSDNLRSRREIYRFQNPRVDLSDWIVSRIDGSVGSALDVGCGPGTYLEKLSHRSEIVVGVDLSPGMVQEARKATSTVTVADALHLPFIEDTFDTTLCIHMLYHVPDIEAAIAELRRVTRPGGRVVVATNGLQHMRQLRETFDRVVTRLGSGAQEPVLSSARRFRMEEGEAMLRPFFEVVIRDDVRARLEVPEVEPILDYLESVRSFHEHKLPESLTWDAVMREFRSEVEAVLERKGIFEISNHTGIFICGS
ncbi:MAG: methyltransferase domain-containing protein [Actinobacteria bacterium]|nr:methyltransferase domain-containing protein [Actinomycetota bacterium]